MKRALIVFAAFMMLASGVMAKKECLIVTKNKKITPEDIKSDARGTLLFKVGKFKRKLKPNEYIYARVPKPKSIWNADKLMFKEKEYAKAASEYAKEGKEYKHLGWDVYCAMREGQALKEAGKPKDAIKVLEELRGYDLKDPEKKDDLNKAMVMLVGLLVQEKKFSEAESYISKLAVSPDDDVAAFALNAQGDIYKSQGKRKDATLKYLQTVLMFPEKVKEERARALFEVVGLLKAQHDSREKKFRDMLMQEYPQSPYAKELK